MRHIKKVIFVEEHGDARAPMAEAIFNELVPEEKMKAESRGLIVLFPTPMNQKAEAVLKGNGLNLPDFVTKELEVDDMVEENLIITMEYEQKQQIYKEFGEDIPVWVLTELTGDELEIMNPYGAPLPSYGLCYETLNVTVKKLVALLNEGE